MAFVFLLLFTSRADGALGRGIYHRGYGVFHVGTGLGRDGPLERGQDRSSSSRRCARFHYKETVSEAARLVLAVPSALPLRDRPWSWKREGRSERGLERPGGHMPQGE